MNQAEQLTSAHFRAYQALHTPIWICAAQPVQLTWANNAALALGHAAVMNDALAEPVDTGAIAEQRVLQYVEQFQAGNPTPDLTDLYVDGQWCSLKFQSSYCSTAEGSSAVLVEGVLTRHPTESTLLASHRLFKAGPTVMFRWRVSDGWAVEEVSPNVYEQFGYLPEALIQGRVRYADLIHPDDMAQVWREVQDYSAAKVPWFEQSYRLHHADGSYRWLYDFTTVVRNAQGQITHYLGYVQDVSDRKRIEEERKQIEAVLREQEARWEYALEGNGDGVWDWNVQTDTVFFSRRWKDMLGYADHEIGDRLSEWDSRVHPDDKAKVYAAIENHVQSHTPQYVSEYRVRCKDGSYKWILDRGRVFRWTEDGKPLRVIGTHTDISERKAMEAALQESETRYRSVIAAMAEGIVLQQANGQIIACNASAEAILGLSQEQMMGCTSIGPHWHAVHEDGSPFPADRHPAMLALRTGQPQTNVIMGVHKPDGSLTWISINAQPIKAAHEENPHAVVASFTDITKRKAVEAALRLSETAKQAMLEAIPDMLVCINREGFFHDLIAGESIKLWRPTEPNWQQSVYQEMPHDLAVKRMQYITMALDTGQIQCYSQTIEVDGELRHEEARIVPMSADEVLVMVRDMTDYVRSEQALQESERRFHAIFDHMYQFIGLLTPDGMVLEANQTALDFGGLQRADVVGRFFWELGCWRVSPKIPIQLREAIAQAAEGKFVRYEVDVQGRGGQMITIDFSLRPIFDAAGNVVLLIPEGRNITDRKQMEVQIQQQADRDRLIGSIGQHIRQSLNLSEILDTTVLDLREAFQSDRVLICRLDSRTVTANTTGRVIAESYSGNYGSLLGQSIELGNMLKPCGLESFTGERVCAITDVGKAGLPQPCVHFLQANQVRAMLLQPIVRNDELWGLLVVHQCSGSRIWNAAEMELLTQVSYQVAIAIQQSELYQQLLQVNRELQHIATHDKLTGLPNRRYFDEYLQKEWLRLTRERSLLSLILCDIDHFKAYNDTYGHLAGDTCLAQVALAIQRAVYRPADVVARYGGEEFAIILPNTDRAGAVKVAQHIQQHLAELAIPHLTSPSSTQITISMGIATAQPMLKVPFQFIIDRADEALYRMKKTGRNGYELAP
ncbi:PAS domain S-box protein [Leptolyngbya sp. AN02str]|uniref:PAS domain S-box protein n=1 Tax=Leptolyngbya sp. AN02str TaxID=3423363 RepID=UPI003D316C3B